MGRQRGEGWGATSIGSRPARGIQGEEKVGGVAGSVRLAYGTGGQEATRGGIHVGGAATMAAALGLIASHAPTYTTNATPGSPHVNDMI